MNDLKTPQPKRDNHSNIDFETDYVSISVDKGRSLLLLRWLRQITLGERQIGFRTALDITTSQGIKYWLIDDRNLSVITDAEKEWILSCFLEDASKTTIRRLAVVVADYYPSLMANTDFTAKGQAGYREKGHILHEVFPDNNSALEWLFSVEE
jgi:hypothetical protein